MTRGIALLVLLGCGSVNSVGDAGSSPQDAAIPDAAIVTDGLVAWYPMDALVNQSVSDAAGHHDGRCGADACPALIAPGRVGGGAYMFDGQNDLLRVTSTADLETASGFTVTAWVNRAANSPDACIVNKSFGSNGANSWQACINAAGQLAFFSTGANGDDSQTSGNIDTGRWHHIALWWDGSTKATYLDGHRIAATPSVAIAFDTSDITIGSDVDPTGLTAPLQGQLDDTRIYNRALRDDELVALQSP